MVMILPLPPRLQTGEERDGGGIRQPVCCCAGPVDGGANRVSGFEKIGGHRFAHGAQSEKAMVCFMTFAPLSGLLVENNDCFPKSGCIAGWISLLRAVPAAIRAGKP